MSFSSTAPGRAGRPRSQPACVPFFAMALLVVALLFSLPAAADDEPSPLPPLGTRTASFPGVEVVERTVEGHPLSAAVLPADLGLGLAVLVVQRPDPRSDEADDELPKELWALHADPHRAPERLATGLPHTLEHVELRRGPGGEELWLGGDGVVYRLEDGKAKPILAAPGLDLDRLFRSGLLDLEGLAAPYAGGVAIPELGRLRLTDRSLAQVAEIPMPVSARRTRTGLVLDSPQVVYPKGSGLLVAGPVARGGNRLEVTLVDPGAMPDAKAQDAEAADAAGTEGKAQPEDERTAWIRLPSPEDVEQARFVVLDGVPRLAIATTDAQKLGIFEEMAIRLYALTPDLTRGGVGPLLATETQTKYWHRIGIDVADLDRDGNDDLAILQPEGMGAGDLVIDVYMGLGKGRVGTSRKRSTKLDARDAEWHWGDDFTGDGVPDLFIAAHGDKFGLWPGDPDHRRRVLEKDPVWIWEPGDLANAVQRVPGTEGEDGPTPNRHFSTVGTVRVHQLDDDELPEISMTHGRTGRTVVRFVLPK